MYLAAGGGKLDGVGEEVLYNFLHVVAHVVHEYLLFLRFKGERDTSSGGNGSVAFGNAPNQRHNVAMLPSRLLHGCAGGHLGNVEDLVDEPQQPLFATHNGGGIAMDFAIGRGEAHHFTGGRVDNGEGRAELVGDVGEEIGAHLLRLFHNLLLPGTHPAGIEQEADGGAGEEKRNDEADERNSADGFLFLVV